MLDALKRQLIQNEGLKLKPYRDTVGKLTIGVGRNLDDRGITEAEAEYLLNNDILATIQALQARPWFQAVKDDEIRARVLIDMAFNMGIKKLEQFQETLACVQAGDFNGASVHMMDSKWAKQVGQRAQKLSHMMCYGVDAF